MDREKHVDESWKESAAQEKEQLKSALGRKEVQQSTGAQQPQGPQPQERPAQSAEPASGERSPHQEETQSVEVNFLNYLTSLGFQAMIFLGEIPNPVTNATEKNLEQAKFLIDTLILLREKTKGNLTEQESNLLNGSIYELQMKYVELDKKESKEQG